MDAHAQQGVIRYGEELLEKARMILAKPITFAEHARAAMELKDLLGVQRVREPDPDPDRHRGKK